MLYLNLGTSINFEAKQCKFTDIYSLENVLPKFRQCAKYNFACQLEKECFHTHEPLSEAYSSHLWYIHVALADDGGRSMEEVTC